jgi:hypothetical protein
VRKVDPPQVPLHAASLVGRDVSRIVEEVIAHLAGLLSERE